MKAPIKYCHTCKRKLDGWAIARIYDKFCGDPEIYYQYECPANKGKRFWQRHRTWSFLNFK